MGRIYEKMVKKGIKTFIEMRPGKVLTGLMRRITKEVKILNPEDGKGLERIFQQEL